MRACFSSLVGLAVAVGVVVASPLARAQADDPWAMAMVANESMENWSYAEADDLVLALDALWPDHPAVLFVRGKYAFHMGQYDEAADLLGGAVAAAPGVDAIRELHDLVVATRDVVRDYAVHRTADGLFEIHYDDRRDALLIPWAEETLEAAYYEVGYDIGSWPEPPIRVEIYPRASTLARVSSLTEEAIEASGTIALCKYNKLMFTSPRATLRGYGWRTTIAHEYVHYAVGHLVRADVPIWLHEALAKYLESRWTGARDLHMPPYREELLGERIEADDLISFEEMHPSMAYLPTPADAATAYAEVFTIMEYIVARRGSGAIREVLYRIRDGSVVIAAFEETLGEPFGVFEHNWMDYLRSRPRVEIPGTFREEMQLLPEDTADPDVDRFAGVESVEAQDYLRLGELLRARDLVAAAVVEYRKAEALLGAANPVLQNAMARALLDVGEPEDALAALDEVTGWHPNYYASHLHRGEALVALGRPEEAVDALLLAGGVNPFDPGVHRQLALAYGALGDAELAARHRRFAALATP